MIAAGFGFEAAVAGGPGRAIRGDPVPEPRSRADEVPARIAGDRILVLSFAVYHQAHTELLLRRDLTLLSKNQRKQNRLCPRRSCWFDHLIRDAHP